MVSWLIRAIWGPPDAFRALVRGLERRVESLSDDLAALEARHNKLQGRVTGGLRGQPRTVSQDDLGIPGDINEFIRQGGRPDNGVRVPENDR